MKTNVTNARARLNGALFVGLLNKLFRCPRFMLLLNISCHKRRLVVVVVKPVRSCCGGVLHDQPHLLKLSRRWSEQSSGLLAGGTRRCKAQHLLDVLPDGHRAEDVEKDEGTLGVVIAGQVSMA